MKDQSCRSTNSTRLLFFGRAKCDFSRDLLAESRRLGFDVTYVESSYRGESLPDGVFEWEGEFIFCFRSLFRIPKSLLVKAHGSAINFHPGPPEYPGSGCINFALYDGVQEFGVTAHLMNERIDNGRILQVRRFPISEDDGLMDVLYRTHCELFDLCAHFLSQVRENGEKFIEDQLAATGDIKWVGEARKLKDLEELQRLHVGISEEELKRIVRATYTEKFPPSIVLHGFKFTLSSDRVEGQ